VTSNDKRRVGDLKKNIVAGIVSSGVKSKALRKPSQTKRFLRQYVEYVPVEDIQGKPTDVLARAAIDHLDFGANRRKGQALIRIFNPTEKEHGYTSAYTFIELVNDDMPFLVDSVAAAIKRHDLDVRITVHPVVSVRRDSNGRLTDIVNSGDKGASSESFIRIAIERENDPATLKILRQEIVRVLRDVRVAVRDWEKMRERMRETRDLLEFGPKGVDPLLRTESQALLDWMVDQHFTFLGYRETN